tara:strand:+ start:120 stop:593 length:474 start_codon:yes stop_codon:yes gene_type:complete
VLDTRFFLTFSCVTSNVLKLHFHIFMSGKMAGVIVGAEVWAWLGLGAAVVGTAAVLQLAHKSSVSAKMKQYARDNQAKVEQDFIKNEPREPTPFTSPSLFTNDSISGQKVHIKKDSGEVWQEDMLHATHFEVYASRKAFEKGTRNRAVWLHGRSKPL